MSSVSNIIADRMQVSRRQLDEIAHNLANSDTPGFKRMVSVANKRSAGEGGSQSAETEGGNGLMSSLDLSSGNLRHTDRPLDLAVEDAGGFFGVQTSDGLRFTAHGRFRLDGEGTLVDTHGHPVVGGGGEIRVPPDAESVVVRPSGEVLADGEGIGQIDVFRFEDPSELRPEGNNLLNTAGEEPDPDGSSSIVQGAVEESNVNPMRELVRMLSVSRSYEKGMQVTRNLGETKTKILDRLA